MSEKYDEDYFLRGKETGKSLYENYRWMPELTIPMCKRIVEHCGINKKDTILDFGCARGYVVKALRGLEYNAYGYDVSRWAVVNADPEIHHYVTCSSMVTFGPSRGGYDWIIAKDVLEHVEYVNGVISQLLVAARKGVFAVVPLSDHDLGRYVVEDYEKDVTHCQRWSLTSWVRMFLRPGWSVEASYRVPGVKDNYKQYLTGNGFITARRIEE